MRTTIAAALLGALAATPALAQDPGIWADHSVATGQAAVLDHMNRENTRRLHREKGLPAPDFQAAERRLRDRNAARATANGQPNTVAGASARRAANCALVRRNLHRLTTAQMSIYRRGCT